MNKELENLRTWVEVDSRAAKKNYNTFRKLIGPRVKLWAVVKSNAYGHGLFAFSEVMDRCGVDGFCVDSVVEGVALRRAAGIKKPILVLGSTLPSRYAEAARNGLTVSISNFEALAALVRGSKRGKGRTRSVRAGDVPYFHLKIDTGMHRQGFYPEGLPRAIRLLEHSAPIVKLRLSGVFTHFASAKDVNYPSYTEMQFGKFQHAVALLEGAGFKGLTKHVAATGGTLAGAKYHLDAVRIGIGLYGLWPSKEFGIQLGHRMKLHPVLSWRAIVTEVKDLKAGDYVGYDLTERVPHATTMAVLPIGYWHGFPRALSGIGQVLVRGRRAKVLGRISMDMTVVALAGGVARAKSGRVHPGDIATMIGRAASGRYKDEIFAWEPSEKSGTSYYEFLTRLNPLMERIIV